jgi:hypothetical protein
MRRRALGHPRGNIENEILSEFRYMPVGDGVMIVLSRSDAGQFSEPPEFSAAGAGEFVDEAEFDGHLVGCEGVAAMVFEAGG